MTREGPFWDVMAGRAAPPPAATLLGWELVAIDPEAGTIEVAFTASEQFLNPVGAIQGGFLAAMLDDTLGPALVATLGPGLFAPTTDLHVQFLRQARPGRLTGRGRVVRRGREVAFLAGELLDDSGQVVATAVATAQIRAIMPGPGPSGSEPPGPGRAGSLPATAVHDLAERPPVGLADRAHDGARRPASRIWSSSSTGIGRSAKDRTLRREVIASQVCMLPSFTPRARTAARAARPTSSARTLRPVRRPRRAGLRDGRAPPG
jgi:uncharacterized protein (TIGR00369 family)